MLRAAFLLAFMALLLYGSVLLARYVMRLVERQVEAKEKAAKALEQIARGKNPKTPTKNRR